MSTYVVHDDERYGLRMERAHMKAQPPLKTVSLSWVWCNIWTVGSLPRPAGFTDGARGRVEA